MPKLFEDFASARLSTYCTEVSQHTPERINRSPMPQRQTAKRCFVRLYLFSVICFTPLSPVWFMLLVYLITTSQGKQQKANLSWYTSSLSSAAQRCFILKDWLSTMQHKVVRQPIITSHHKEDNDHQPASRYKLSTHFIQAAAQRRDRCLQLTVWPIWSHNTTENWSVNYVPRNSHDML